MMLTPDRANVLSVASGVMVLTAAWIGRQSLPEIGVAGVCLGLVLGLTCLARNQHVNSAAGMPYLVIGGAAVNAVSVVVEVGLWSLPLAAFFVGAAGWVASGDVEPSRRVRWAFVLGTVMAYGSALTLGHPPFIDVHVFLTEGVHALLHGQNPYSINYTNIFGPTESAAYYGPGVVQHGRISYGFPYPPLTLMTALPGYLLGDVRLSALIAQSALAALLIKRASTVRARRAAVLLLCAPGVLPTLLGSWVEPVCVALLGAVVLANQQRRYMLGALALGLMLVSKQYFAAVLPCLWLLRPYATRARVLATLIMAILSTLPFVLWDVAGAWRGIVEFQFVQPFRGDATSIVAVAVNHLHLDPPGWIGPVSLLVGLLASTAAARWFAPGATSFSLAIALSLGILFLFSKQAFLNYYALCGCALLIAAWSRANDAGGMPLTRVSRRRAGRDGGWTAVPGPLSRVVLRVMRSATSTPSGLTGPSGRTMIEPPSE